MLKHHALAFGLSMLVVSGSSFAQGPGSAKKDAKPAEGRRGDGDRGFRPDLFQAVDTDDEGTISRAELNAFFDLADVDKDGTVDRDEVNRAVIKAWVARLKAMDTNNDGLITRAEWRGPKELFDRLDPDNDGSISREEVQAGADHFRQESGRGNLPSGGGGERKGASEKQESKGAAGSRN